MQTEIAVGRDFEERVPWEGKGGVGGRPGGFKGRKYGFARHSVVIMTDGMFAVVYTVDSIMTNT